MRKPFFSLDASLFHECGLPEHEALDNGQVMGIYLALVAVKEDRYERKSKKRRDQSLREFYHNLFKGAIRFEFLAPLRLKGLTFSIKDP